MGLRGALSKPLARYIVARQNKWAAQPVATQEKAFQNLIRRAQGTAFGRDHDFAGIRTHADFVERVPVRDYEALRPWVDRMVAGEPDILWPGKPFYFAKTSGTTSGAKFIPITKESIPYHINSARNALMNYIVETGRSSFLDKKLIFLSGSPEMTKKNGVHVGRLSGIVNHHVPSWLRSNQLPSYETNCIEDWEEKLDKIIDETLHKDMGLISGIPPWVQMYFDRIIERTGKPIHEVFPNFEVFVYGGVNFEPYRSKLYESIGRPVPSVELYPASEGFFAYQDSQQAEGMLMLLNSGMFYEFIPAEEYFNENPTRLSIGEVELNKNYALVINSNAGLWGYSIGDTVKFVNDNPYRMVVTGRIKHFISAFGEHVIGEEVENAMRRAQEQHPEVEIIEFTVGPNVTPPEGLPRHEWYVSFATPPKDMEAFAQDLDNHLRDLNSYYDDLIKGAILKPCDILPLTPTAFQNYMKSVGKLGGQNKVPRLSNDRTIPDALQPFRVQQ